MFKQTLTGEGYEVILRDTLILFMREKGQDFYLVEDNSSIHTSEHVQNFIRDNGIRTINLPAYSPDLNTIGYKNQIF